MNANCICDQGYFLTCPVHRSGSIGPNYVSDRICELQRRNADLADRLEAAESLLRKYHEFVPTPESTAFFATKV